MKNLTTILAICAILSASGTAQAVLIDRGNGLIYDDDLNITWLQDANLAASNTFGLTGINAYGTMNWSTAQSWIDAMNDTNYLDYNDWRLPTVTDTGAPGCDFAHSGTDCGYNVNTATGDMAHLYYDENTNYESLFTNLQTTSYWYGTEYALGSDATWYFDFDDGFQYGGGSKTDSMYALAVRPGDVAAVPEPETYTMLLAGLGLLGFTARHKKNSVA